MLINNGGIVIPDEMVVGTPEQANCLRQGLRIPGVEDLTNPARINNLLERVENGYVEQAIIPDHLHGTVRGLAKLVMTAELEYTQGLVASGQVDQLAIRLGSEHSITAKFSLLRPFLDAEPTQRR
jgi:hypothetical protein